MAKRLLRLLYVFFILVVLQSGCTQQSLSSPQKCLVTDFSADFAAQYRSAEYKGYVSTNRQGIVTINITYPETIEGLRFKYYGTDMEISRESLICSADEAYLPDRSFPSVLRSLFSGVGQGRETLVSDSEETTYTLSVPMGNAVLTASENLLTRAEIKDIGFTIEFSDIKASE